MKSSDPLLLADGNLHCGMYPAGKVAISRHLPVQLLYNDFVDNEPRIFFDRHKKNVVKG